MKIATLVLIGLVLATLLACIGITWDVFDSGGSGFTVDDTTVTLSDIGAGQRLAVGIAVFVAVAAALVVAAIAILIGLVAAVFGIACAVLVALAVAAVAFSPVILVVLLIWLVVRSSSRDTSPAAAPREPSIQA